VITKPHHFRHFLLQIGPIHRPFCLRILRKCARGIENRVTAENEKLFDAACVDLLR
jgi:hypothetical protein